MIKNTVFSLLVLTSFSLQAAEVLEIGPDQLDQLPGGKEADGIAGDFVLSNSQVKALISGNLPLRRANMSTFYGDGNETPGCLFDLTRRRKENDQITIFSPSSQKGPVSHVRIFENDPKGKVSVETVTTAARGDGIYTRHLYILKNRWRGILIVTTIRNETKTERQVKISDLWTQMRSKGTVKGIHWADAVDSADKCGYAYAWVKEEGASIPKGTSQTLRAGEEIKIARFLAVGRSPADAIGIVARRRDETKVGRVYVKILDATGKGISTARMAFTYPGAPSFYAYPDSEGKVDLSMIAGEHSITIEDIGREAISQKLTIVSQRAMLDIQYAMSPQSGVQFNITDGEGKDMPCKVQFNPLKGTARPDLGTPARAHGCMDQWHSETGKFRAPLPPGDYRIIVTRGPEYSYHVENVKLEPGVTLEIEAKLEHLVKTPGWVSTDFHDHSTPSGDNTCGTDDRVISLAVEQIEFAPTTEHNRLYDWEPHIKKLGLSAFIKTIPGMELTGRGAHFNMFPLKPEPGKQDNGAPVWQKDPRLNAIVLRDFQGQEPDRWVHLNHPDMSENFIDRNKDGKPDGGYKQLASFLDALETQNYKGSRILKGVPFAIEPARTGLGKSVAVYREFIWLQLLNQGLKIHGIATNDAHYVYGNGVGAWRTYIPSSTDDPAKIDWREISRNAKAGKMILTTGPYLEVSTASGTIAGGSERVKGKLDLNVKVQCSNWLDIDRVQVLVNGRQDPRYNYTRTSHPDWFGNGVVKFDKKLSLDLKEDAHLIVVAIGENSTIQNSFGSSRQSSTQPCAYNNPIYIDTDGGGFQPNGDTLGFDLPVGGLSVNAVGKILKK